MIKYKPLKKQHQHLHQVHFYIILIRNFSATGHSISTEGSDKMTRLTGNLKRRSLKSGREKQFLEIWKKCLSKFEILVNVFFAIAAATWFMERGCATFEQIMQCRSIIIELVSTSMAKKTSLQHPDAL